MFYIKLAWRNLFRNKRRTIIASIAIGIGLAALLFTASTMKGMEANMIRSATASFLGQGQIHGGDFRITQDVEKTVSNLSKITNILNHEPLVDHYATRTLSMGMISSPANVSAILLVGVTPDEEKDLSQMDDAIVQGSFFTSADTRDIVIGNQLAEILEIGIGDRVVVTAAQAQTGELSQEMFRVSGIYKFDLKELDNGFALIRLPKAQQMLGIGKGVHQVVFSFKDINQSIDESLPIWKHLSLDGNEAVSWVKILPQLKAMSAMTHISIFILVIILGAVVTFGIINTLFMSLYERMFEFAVLRAVGTRRSGIRKLILFEAGSLAIISIALGLIMGFGLTAWVSHTGINYKGIEFAGTTIKDMIYPEMSLLQFTLFPIGVLFFTIMVAIYPAWAAGRLKIADGMRKSL